MRTRLRGQIQVKKSVLSFGKTAMGGVSLIKMIMI